jgi:hypothetical protein
MSRILTLESFPVPHVSTYTESGSAFPISYETWIRPRSATISHEFKYCVWTFVSETTDSSKIQGMFEFRNQ